MLVVANGHHWDKRWPEPAFPGADTFGGIQLHAHDYRDNEFLAGKDVVVLGMGNSAMDIAVESSYVAQRDAARRPPRRLDRAEVPVRAAAGPAQLAAARPALARQPRRRARRPPAHRAPRALRPAEARPPLPRRAPDRSRGGSSTASSTGRSRRGRTSRGSGPTGSSSPTARACMPTSSSTARATGSRFRSSTTTSSPCPTTASSSTAASSRRATASLAFVGLLQPIGAIMPLAEEQGRWIADYLRGDVPPAVAARDGGGDPPRQRAHAQALRRLQAPHDPGRLRHVPVRPAARAPARRGARGRRRATRCRCRRAPRRGASEAAAA